MYKYFDLDQVFLFDILKYFIDIYYLNYKIIIDYKKI